MKDNNEELFIRVIKTYPRQKIVGRWRNGLLYTLYNVVINNGSKFMSLNAKPKEEPYVIYNPQTKVFYANEGWELIEASADSKLTAMSLAGAGGGGGGGDVTPSGLEKSAFFGGTDTELIIAPGISDTIFGFASTKRNTTSGVPCNRPYFYIAVPSSYSLRRAVTENMETITGLFSLKGTYLQGEDEYKLYEFHLSSNMPLNADITITIS